MRITLLTTSSPQSDTLISLVLKEGLNLTRVVLVNKKKKPISRTGLVLNSLIKWVAPMKQLITLDLETRLALKLEKKCADNAERFLSKYLSDNRVEASIRGIEYLHVEDVNAEEVVEAFRSDPPDICMVYGTGIIKSSVINLARCYFLNAHSSVLPKYRGTRAEFWQCYYKDLEDVGITIHGVDEGIDTGPIYFQKKNEYIELAEPFMLRALNTIAILENYPRVVKQIIDGQLTPIKQTPLADMKAFRHKDISLDKRINVYKRLLGRVKD